MPLELLVFVHTTRSTCIIILSFITKNASRLGEGGGAYKGSECYFVTL